MVRYPLDPGAPYIWLQEKEEEGSADCGCRLEQDNGAKLTFCTMHAAAPKLLEYLEIILHNLPSKGPRGNRFPVARTLVEALQREGQAQ